MRVNGLVLNGGASSRMGRAKSELLLGGTTLFAQMEQKLARIGVEKIYESGQELPDRFLNRGPLAGIEAALHAMPDTNWLIVPVDMPLLSHDLLLQLLQYGQKEMALSYYEKAYLPLFIPATAGVSAAKIAEQKLQSTHSRKSWSLWGWLDACGAHKVVCPQPELLLNANTPEQWDECKMIWSEQQV